MTKQTRRKFVIGSLGLLGGSVLTAWVFRRSLIRNLFFTFDPNPNISLTPAPISEAEPCILTSSQVEGPFYFPSPHRIDIREDREGKETNLKIQVLRYPDCSPIENAIVEVWHSDAEGNYSGYPEEIAKDEWQMFMLFAKHGEGRSASEFRVKPVSKTTYLRGLQKTDQQGWCTFKTIFPCWYIGRVPHIHFKVFIGDKESLNAQFYFEKAFCDNLFTTTEPYTKMGICPIDFQNDGVLALTSGTQNGLVLRPDPGENESLMFTARIGIKTA
ncbi:MAG: hypothetical protein SF052_04705 [Bacteroidia bacterium]|nr:hypothetical protein [Bacteroidia bacterium]